MSQIINLVSGKLAQNQQPISQVLTCRNGCRPGQPVIYGVVGVVESKMVLCARKTLREAYRVRNLVSFEGFIRCWETYRRIVI